MAVRIVREATDDESRSIEQRAERQLHPRFYSPLRRFSSFYSGVCAPLCVVRQKEKGSSGRRGGVCVQVCRQDRRQFTSERFSFVSAAFLKVAWRHFHSARYHVGRSGVGLFERGGPNQPLPAPPGVQGWRRRCLVLAPTANLEPSCPHGGGHLLRLDSHTLGSPFWKGNDTRSHCFCLFEGTVSSPALSLMKRYPE